MIDATEFIRKVEGLPLNGQFFHGSPMPGLDGVQMEWFLRVRTPQDDGSTKLEFDVRLFGVQFDTVFVNIKGEAVTSVVLSS